MSQNSTEVLDGTGVQVLGMINNALDTLETLHAGATAPLVVKQWMLWADTTANELKICSNVTGPVWLTLGKLAANGGMVPLVGNSSITGTLNTTDDFTVGTNKLIVDAQTGNTTVAGTLSVTGATTLGAVLDEKQGTAIASAATTNIATAIGNFVDVSGVTTITALGTVQAGAERCIRFTGSLLLSHNAAITLPGAQSIQTANGDVAYFRSLGGGNWMLTSYQKADGVLPELKAADVTVVNGTTDIASAKGNYIVLNNTSGVNAITSFGNAPAGVRKELTFNITGGTASITYNATSMLLPGNSNLSVGSGDNITMISLGGGNWRCTKVQASTLAMRMWQTANRTSAVSYQLLPEDFGKFFIYNVATDTTLILPAVGSVASGYICAFRNNSSTAKLDITRLDGALIEKQTHMVISPAQSASFISDGTAWWRFETSIGGILATGETTFTNLVEYTSGTSVGFFPSTTQIRITCWGGGGGGSGGAGYNGSSYVGQGATGGTSSVSALISATGGQGGNSASVAVGGTGVGGQIATQGGSGGSRSSNTSGSFKGGGGGGGVGNASGLAFSGQLATQNLGGLGAPGPDVTPNTGVLGGFSNYQIGVSGSGGGGNAYAYKGAQTFIGGGQGGGGGGSGMQASGGDNYTYGGGGGGAGGYARGVFTVSIGTPVYVTVGYGGGGGAGGGTNYTTTYNAVTFTGGSGGQGGGNGGSAAVGGSQGGNGGNAQGTTNVGGAGTAGVISSVGGASVTTATGLSATAGGGGGSGGNYSTTSSGGGGGGRGSFPGGGGGGGGGGTYNVSNTMSGQGGGGGAGAFGCVIIEY